MKIQEFLSFLSYFKNLQQLEALPNPEYVEALFCELQTYDARYIGYAILQVARNEITYNRYPLLAEILKYVPSFAQYRHELERDAEKLKNLLSQHYRKNHYFYEYHQREIRALSRTVVGKDDHIPTHQEIDAAVRARYKAAVDSFFGQQLPEQLLITKENEKCQQISMTK